VIEALYRRLRTTKPEPGHKVYPYLLRGAAITRPNQVWAMDITYIPMARGFVYLAVVARLVQSAGSVVARVALDEDVVSPRTFAVHADRDAVLDQQAGERGARELRALVGVEDLRLPCLASASSNVSTQNAASRVIESDQLVIELANAKGAGPKRKRSRNVIEVPWHKTPSTRRREVLVPEAGPPQDARHIRSENRAILVASIARGRRWLDELIADPTANTESIAGREGCSVRKVNMTISLAFLAPDLVKAAIDGRLPHGMGVARLCDLPAEWSRQRQMLGLAAL
jgi:hypothetical protein